MVVRCVAKHVPIYMHIWKVYMIETNNLECSRAARLELIAMPDIRMTLHEAITIYVWLS